MNAESLDGLRQQASAAMRNAYAPYSGFRVGAALLDVHGGVTIGCNVENAAYPSGICAERAAVASAVAAGSRDFAAIVIATEADTPTPPCGMCRQVLMEFSPELRVVSVTQSGVETQWSISDLLPEAFTPTSMGRR